MSHSTRVRGLKYLDDNGKVLVLPVALYTSAWIEIIPIGPTISNDEVALYTSAWIEIEKY